MNYQSIVSVADSLDEAYKGLVKQIKDEEKTKGVNQYYDIKHSVSFSKDDKEKPLYCFKTIGRDSTVKEF